MRFSALLWDMDGTLFDTYPPLRQALIEVFREAGVTVSTERAARLLAVTFDHALETLAAEYGLDPAPLKDAYYDRAAHIPPETQPPFPGVTALCRRVAAAGGRNLIFTHRGRESLDRFLTLYGMADLFSATLTVDQGYPRKPDPTGFLTLITQSGLTPADALAVGDRDLDIEAGIAAGIATCCFAPADFPGGAPPPAARPDYTIASYAELENLLFSV